MEDYNLGFLKEKEFFKTEQPLVNPGPSGESIAFIFDPENRLAFFEDVDKNNIRAIFTYFKERFNFDYYWFWEEGRLVVYRTVGEHKEFILNIEHARNRRKNEFLKSKLKKLREFSKDNPNILFDVKDVVDKFYQALWDIRLNIANAIQEDISDTDKLFSAQRLIDRLIFTYFLVEKRIIKSKDQSGRDNNFKVKELFEYLLATSKDFHEILNNIFFNFLNSKVNNEMPLPESEELFLIIPYLNGGLFREKMLITKTGTTVGESQLHIEGFDWNDLINELNKYNWQIEDDPTKEAEENIIGNLTPEILGHIYEKFVITLSNMGDIITLAEIRQTTKGEIIKGRKKVGGYYTPEDVVQYISEKTLFSYIQNKLNLNEKIDSFEKFYDKFRNDTKKLGELDKYLSEITILDPAVGSGHFLMTSAEILSNWRRKCGTRLDDYSLRKKIILDNLYGVDIMEGAVEICKLRLWLWLVASQSRDSPPEALPNIEFNIREGNSLIGFTKFSNIGQRYLIEGNVTDEVKNYMENIKQFKNSQNDIVEQKSSLDKQHLSLHEKFNRWYSKYYIRKGKRRITPKELERLNIFHWIMEFPNIFDPDKIENGFDIVIGNPPWGISVLKPLEKRILTNYVTSGSNEISAYFLERELNLLKERGAFSNIIAGSIAVNKQLAPSRDLIREKLANPKVTFIGIRPSKIFQDVDKRVCIIFGIKDTSKIHPIYSSMNIRFRKEDRSKLLDNLTFENTEGLLLGSRIGIRVDKEKTRLPKIGKKEIRSILETLKRVSDKERIIEEITNSGKFSLDIRTSGRYWLHALKIFPYQSSMIKSISFDNEVERNFILSIISSSLFYLYWSVYGNNHHLNIGIIQKFPVPARNKLLEKEEEIKELSDKVNDALLGCFDKYGGEFDTGKCKHILDEVDDFLGELYELSSEQVKYIQSYDALIRM